MWNSSFNTASGMDCMQSVRKSVVLASSLVSIPQAVWIACNLETSDSVVFGFNSFNTASGMDCMQSPHTLNIVADDGCFNTASGMDCMQLVRG